MIVCLVLLMRRTKNVEIDKPENKKGTSLSSSLLRCCRTLRREATERPAYITLAQPLQRAVTKLTHPFTSNAEQGSNLFERVLPSALEPEVQAENLCISRRKGRQRRLDLVVEEAIHCLLLGVGHFVGDEALDERAIAF